MLIASAEQMRELDRRAVELGTSIETLMDRAGAAVYDRLPSGSVAVVCGKGNNGGDGFVVAQLAMTDERRVLCMVAAEEAELRPDAMKALQNLRVSGLEPIFASDARYQFFLSALSSYDVVVDALLGTGATREVDGPIREAIRAINRADSVAVSIDVPSGVECDSGAELGECVGADQTVTLGYAKPFLFHGRGSEVSGSWSVADIGLPAPEQPMARLITPDWARTRVPARAADSNKGRNGHVLVVAGSEKMRGAATLVAQASLRAGAGLVTVAAIEKVCAAVAAQLPEAVLLPLEALDERAAQAVLEYQERVDCGVFGPGMTTSEPVRGFLANVFRAWHRPALVDADALNALALGVQLPASPCVLTPHPGEAARLLHITVDGVQSNRFESVRKLADKTGKCVLLKGRYSIVQEPGSIPMVNRSGNSGLATGGSGDTLSGVIGTLLAQGLSPYDAASVGMYWHGRAADFCADSIGGVGYLPSEVARALPATRDRLD